MRESDEIGQTFPIFYHHLFVYKCKWVEICGPGQDTKVTQDTQLGQETQVIQNTQVGQDTKASQVLK